MKAIVKAKPELGLSWMEVDKPSIKENEVLIKIHSTGICGTDLHIYNWDAWAAETIRPPLTIGHEFMGEIAEVGSEVKNFKVGERVSGEGHITCGICKPCQGKNRHLCAFAKGVGIHRNGGFAEYLSMPAGNVVKLPDNISDEVASILDPLGNAVHTALSFDVSGESVLITGAGPIGLMAAAIVKKAGAKDIVITDLNDLRLEMAKRMGATYTFNVKKGPLKDQLKQEKIDLHFAVGLEMSGNGQALQEMVEMMEPGGKIALLGIPPAAITLDLNKIIFKGLHLKGIYGREMFETWEKMLGLLGSGLDITPIITHRFPAKDFEAAFAAAKSGTAGKVLLEW